MKKNKHSLIKLNTVTSLTFEILTILSGMIIPRYMLIYYGSSINGLVSSITQFLGFISLCEVGMGAVVPANLYKPLAQKDTYSISCIMKSARKFYQLIAFILLLYVMVLATILPVIRKEYSSLYIVSLLVIISLSTFAQYYFGIAYSLLLKADQKQYVIFIADSLAIVFNSVIVIFLISRGLSIHAVKLFSAIVFILRPLFLTYYVNKKYNLQKNVTYSLEPIKQKWNGLAQHFASTVQEKADIIILTFLSTLENVSVYSVYYMIVNGIRGFIYAATAGISASIGTMIGHDEYDELKKTFKYFEWTMHTISILLFSVTSCLIVPFVQIYTCGVKDYDYSAPSFALVLCMALSARCIQMPYNIVVQAANHFKQTQNSAIIEPLVNVLLSIVLVKRYGLIGIAIGTFVAMVYRVIYLAIYLTQNILRISIFDFIKQCGVDLVEAILIYIMSTFFKVSNDSYFLWSLHAIIILVIAVIICLVVNVLFYKSNMLVLKRKVQKKIGLF